MSIPTPSYLFLRNGTYYFQLRVPKKLTKIDAINQSLIRRSTKTGNRRQALSKVALLHYDDLAKYALSLLPQKMQKELALKKYTQLIGANSEFARMSEGQIRNFLPKPVTEIEEQALIYVLSEYKQWSNTPQ